MGLDRDSARAPCPGTVVSIHGAVDRSPASLSVTGRMTLWTSVVANRRPGPISSATISTLDRKDPPSVYSLLAPLVDTTDDHDL